MFEKSPLASILSKVNDAKRNGKKIINLAIGEPDFPVPEYIKNKTIKDIKEKGKKMDGYTETAGIMPLRKKISQRFVKETKGVVSYDQTNVIVTPGAKAALFEAVTAVAAENKEKNNVLIFNPAWPSFASQVNLAGACPVFFDTFKKEISAENLEAAIKNNPFGAIILNSPSNPTGKILSEEKLEEISAFAAKHDIWIIADEIYRNISYVPLPPPAAYFYPSKTITVNGFSKSYAMTGWRLGYAIGPAEIIEKMERWQSQVFTCASSIVQYAGLEALKTEKTVKNMVREFKERREQVAGGLNKIPNISFFMPDGAFYFFIDFKKYLGEEIKTSADLTNYLFDNAGVALAPGSAFGTEGYARLSFAASKGDLQKGISKIKKALINLNARK